MSLATLEPASSATGRAAKGRFGVGNPGGPGNPHVRRLAAMRQAVLAAVTPEDVREIVLALVALAKEGDREAAKVVLQYTLGKPGSWDPAADFGSVELPEPAAEKLEERPAPKTVEAARPAVAPLPAGNAGRWEERLAARGERGRESTVEQMLGITPPSTNGANGASAAAAVSVVDAACAGAENGRRGAESSRAAKK